MRRLWRLVHLLDLRDNPMFTLVGYGLLWTTQFAMAIDRWRARHGRELIEWLRALGEFEALISLSSYALEHPHDVLPDLLEGEPEFDANGLGHPLLDAEICVRNDIQLGDGTRFLIVSGSNMSGKSTFLRAMGQNAVLAWMGAPVRCRKLRLSRLAIGAAIRLQDSLTDGRSHFFAEMDRLRRMIQAAGVDRMLFLADEIMSGTNSHDRRIAAEWVVRALLLRSAIGAITTHDLALTEIAAGGLPGRNVHFEDTGEGGDLKFDYSLRDGILTRSNALNIAHLLGIDAAARKAES
jgi:DNA mismatch repair ATPase MutS